MTSIMSDVSHMILSNQTNLSMPDMQYNKSKSEIP